MSVKGKKSNHVGAYHTAQFVHPSTCHECACVCSTCEGEEDSTLHIVRQFHDCSVSKPLLAPNLNLCQDFH